MTDLPRRSLTAAVYGAVVVLGSLAPPPAFGALLFVGGVVSVVELAALRRAGLAAWLEGVLLVVGLTSLFLLRLTYPGPAPDYGVVPLLPLLFVAILPTWAADVGAYLVGSVVGSHKLAPRLSPGKTWEGTGGGLIAAGLVAVGVGSVGYGLPNVALLGVLVGPVALAGDLLESWVKRRAGVKDSGTIFPGHGGMLDRIDSLIAVAPLVVALYGIPCCGPS